MKSFIFRYILLFLSLAGCTKTEVRPYDFSSDLKIKVNTYTELGLPCNEKGNIEVTVQGTVPELKLITDTSGSCTAKNLPYGTYNMVISKPGYGTTKQLMKHMGVERDVPPNFSIIQNSSTIILNYDLQISGRTITVTGTVSHHYTDFSFYPYDWPGLLMFVSDSPALSATNFHSYLRFATGQDVNTGFQASMSLDAVRFPSGSTAYVVIHGHPRMFLSCFDVAAGSYYYIGLGSPSEVKSIRVP